MKIDSSTKTLSIGSKAFLHLVISLGLVIGFLLLTSFLNRQNSDELLNSVQAMFRSDRDIGNTAYLGKRVSDLESLNVIKCVRLDSESLGNVYTTEFKDGCSESLISGLMNPIIKGEVKSLDGESFAIHFKADSSLSLKIYLWMFFVLSLVITNALIGIYWYRLDLRARALANEVENNRLLDLKVKAQAEELVSVRLEAEIQKTTASIARRVAHDIRSPLMALNMVAKKITGISEESQQMLNDVSVRITGIANDLLAQAKLSPGVQPMQPRDESPVTEAVLLKPLLEKIIREKTLEYHNNSKVIFNLRTQKLSDDDKVVFEEKELARILSNLINNSVEAITDDGTIYIEAFPHNDHLQIRIIDSGSGISEELQVKLLSQTAVTTKTHGSGIGLSSALASITAQGGEMKLTSKLGMGTQVTLSLIKTSAL